MKLLYLISYNTQYLIRKVSSFSVYNKTMYNIFTI
jgi:hypothetical protein